MLGLVSLILRLIYNHKKKTHIYLSQGGFCGFFYVASNILAVPRLGVGTSLALFVCAQVLLLQQHLILS